jgi:hypothetical protein
MKSLHKNSLCCRLFSIGLLLAFSTSIYTQTSAAVSVGDAVLEEEDTHEGRERGLPKLMQAIGNYANDGESATTADLQAQNEMGLQAIVQEKTQNTKSVIIKFLTKILKNAAISSAAMTTLLNTFTQGKESWGIGAGVVISVIDAIASVYDNYNNNMQNVDAEQEVTA